MTLSIFLLSPYDSAAIKSLNKSSYLSLIFLSFKLIRVSYVREKAFDINAGFISKKQKQKMNIAIKNFFII